MEARLEKQEMVTVALHYYPRAELLRVVELLLQQEQADFVIVLVEQADDFFVKNKKLIVYTRDSAIKTYILCGN